MVSVRQRTSAVARLILSFSIFNCLTCFVLQMQIYLLFLEWQNFIIKKCKYFNIFFLFIDNQTIMFIIWGYFCELMPNLRIFYAVKTSIFRCYINLYKIFFVFWCVGLKNRIRTGAYITPSGALLNIGIKKNARWGRAL